MKYPRTFAQLKSDPRVEDAWHDEDGYWVVLRQGRIDPSMESRLIHEYTVRDCCDRVHRSVVSK